jgi:hypothetical protein
MSSIIDEFRTANASADAFASASALILASLAAIFAASAEALLRQKNTGWKEKWRGQDFTVKKKREVYHRAETE